jgi:endonuclease/exonuclease/phosphatase family metal-dependent hydrolase
MLPRRFAGKAVLSHYTIMMAVQTQLGPERPDLMVTLAVSSEEISVVAAYPPPPHLHRTDFHFDHPTLGQIKTLAALALENPMVLLLGDFNLVEKKWEYRFLKSSGLRDAFLDSRRGFGHKLLRRVGPWKRMQLLNR